MQKFKVTKLANNDFLKHNKIGSVVEMDPALVTHMVRTGELEPVEEKASEKEDNAELSSSEEAALMAEMKAEEDARLEAEKLSSDKGKKGEGKK